TSDQLLWTFGVDDKPVIAGHRNHHQWPFRDRFELPTHNRMIQGHDGESGNPLFDLPRRTRRGINAVTVIGEFVVMCVAHIYYQNSVATNQAGKSIGLVMFAG